MSDSDTKYKHSLHRKRNMIAKALRDPNEHKGAFALKVHDSRKSEYRRIRMNVKDVDYDNEEMD